MDETIKAKLTELGFTPEQISALEVQGVVGEAELAMLSEQEIREITSCTIIAAKNTMRAFMKAPVIEAAGTDTTAIQLLPALPDDTSFLEMLKVGGMLKVERVDVIALMRAAIAWSVGLFDLPERLIQRMEEFANSQDEPAPEAFYRLQKQLAERRYADVLSAIGVSGTFVTERRKKETLVRINDLLWPSLRGFNDQLRIWVETWSRGVFSPEALTVALMTRQSGSTVLPPGMLQPPPTDTLRDEGEAVVNRINSVFAGTGIPVSRAMALDAMRIRDVLQDPNLPPTVGAATRDQMLKMLGVNVGADIVRLEQNVTRFALAIMELPNVDSADELAYLSAMWTLGANVPWDKLGSLEATHGVVGSGRTTRVRGDEYSPHH